MVSFNAMLTAAKLSPLPPVENRYKHGVREIGGAGLPRIIPPKYPLPPAFLHLCFQYFARKIFITRNLDAAVSLCRSIPCAIPAKIFYLKQIQIGRAHV